MTDNNKTKLIESFFTGKATANEKATFDQLMKEDAAFKKEADGYKPIFQGLGGLHIDELQSQMQCWEANQDDKVVPLSSGASPFRRYLAIAAAVALLLCVPLVYQSMNSGDVFEEHFHAANDFAVHMKSFRGNEGLSTPEQIKKDAFADYRAENYSAVISQLKDYVNNFPEVAAEDPQSYLVLAVSQMAAGNMQDAVTNLEVVLAGKDATFRQEGQWMWGLAQYKLGNTDRARKMMQKITKQERHAHKIDAMDFLKDTK